MQKAVPLGEMESTFAQLLAFHYPRVHRAARGLLPNDEEASEVAQEALTRAWVARDRYDRARPFYPWLYTIVRNACRDASGMTRKTGQKTHPPECRPPPPEGIRLNLSISLGARYFDANTAEQNLIPQPSRVFARSPLVC